MDIKSGNVQTSTTQLRVPKAMEALQGEILKHPHLMQELRLEEANGKLKTFEDGLAIIAAYADVTLHGMYQADEIGPMCEAVLNKLILKRKPLV